MYTLRPVSVCTCIGLTSPSLSPPSLLPLPSLFPTSFPLPLFPPSPSLGVGGIEAEAVMLGQTISMVLPEVVGYKLIGAVGPLVTSTDVVLTITKVQPHGRCAPIRNDHLHFRYSTFVKWVWSTSLWSSLVRVCPSCP